MPDIDDRDAPAGGTMQHRSGIWGWCDDFFRAAALEHFNIAFGLMFVGMLLAVASFLLPDSLSVQFDGRLKGGAMIAPPPEFAGKAVAGGGTIAPKQVGYGFAPNWLLTGILLLPLAVMQALKARASIEKVIETLVDRRMLVTTDFQTPDKAKILEAWRTRSRKIMPFVAIVAAVVIAMVIYDYLDVVAQWTIATGPELSKLANGVTLHHPDYEFDWSVAAAFKDTTVNRWLNLAFAGAAYFVIAGFGSAFLFGVFIYFIAFGGFFERHKLERQGLMLIPNPQSTDSKSRCGFEEFEEFFDPFIQAAVLTALIALAIYLQNMYLRAPEQPDIFVMVLKPLTDLIKEMGIPGELIQKDLFANIVELTGFQFISRVPLQIFAAAIGLLILVIVVFGYVWSILRSSAISGQKILKGAKKRDEDLIVAGAAYTDADIGKTDDIQVWPLGWVSINFLLPCIVLVIASLYYPRLVSLILAALIAQSIKTVVNKIQGKS